MEVKLDAFDALRGHLHKILNYECLADLGEESFYVERQVGKATYLVDLIEKDVQQRDRYDEEVVQPELERLTKLEELAERGYIYGISRDGNPIYYNIARELEKLEHVVTF